MADKSINDMNATELLDLTLKIALDYDGYRKPKESMSLINEMSEYVGMALKLLEKQPEEFITLPEYRGFNGVIRYSKDDGCLWGKVSAADSACILFDDRDVPIVNAFHEAVDDYIDCINSIDELENLPYN